MPQQNVVSDLTMADLYQPEHMADPYPLYHRIRDVSPVFWDRHMGEDGGAWMVTGYDAALLAIQGKKFSARRPQWNPEHAAGATGPLGALYNQVFVVDPPDHTRIRKLMKKSFLPAAVERMREEITSAADELLDTVLPRGEMDYMQDFAMALPSVVVCRVLGIPLEDRPRVWRRILSWGLVVDAGPMSKENPDFHLTNIGKFMDYFREQIAKRRERRTDDLLQVLADGWDDGAFASEEELLGNLIFLLTAGQTTTAHQIGNTTLALLDNPDVLARMQADPAQVPDATPEFMRYDCSVQLTKRRATAPVELAGQQIEPGQELFIWMGAANRDPEIFANPDHLNPDRPKIQNLALGHGIHYCVGGQLGQLVNEVAIGRFAERIKNPQVDRDKVMRSVTPTFRGAHAMPMTFGAAH